MERQELEDRLAGLRRDRGNATLAGKRFDHTAIAEIEDQIDALADAETERIRREREQAAKDHAANVKAKCKRIADLEARRLQAWADLEAASRALLEAIGRVVATTESERVLMVDVTAATPMQLGHFETAHRIRGRVGELLHAAKVNFETPGAGGVYSSAALEDWKETERKPLAAFIEALMED